MALAFVAVPLTVYVPLAAEVGDVTCIVVEALAPGAIERLTRSERHGPARRSARPEVEAGGRARRDVLVRHRDRVRDLWSRRPRFPLPSS